MEFTLSESEVRVLACLIEKQLSTPEYYPLSLNALLNACNQKTSRDPVVSYGEDTVLAALLDLKERRLVWESTAGRVPKYEETFLKAKNLLRGEAAVLCLLMLRGPQTLGELKAHSERLNDFSDNADLVAAVDNLIDLHYAVKLARQPGHKEPRFAHLLAGEPVMSLSASLPAEAPPIAAIGQDRLLVLQQEIENLRQELQDLKNAFLDFKKQFE